MCCDSWGHNEGERVLDLESREGTRASRRVEEGAAENAVIKLLTGSDQ